MLSNTAGLQPHSRVLGARADATTRLDRICPQLRRRGRCKAYEAEVRLRRSIAAAKEAELLAQATRLYELQLELQPETMPDKDSKSSDTLVSVSANQKKAALQRLVAELKQEPAYLQWSLEAAVEEALVNQRLRRCPYSHRIAVRTAVKRARNEQQQEKKKDEGSSSSDNDDSDSDTTSSSNSNEDKEDALSGSDEDEGADKKSQRRRVHVHAALWRAERLRVFHDMTPFQRWVVLLLWQRRVQLPQKLVRDVRACLTSIVAQEHESTDNNNKSDSDEAMEEYMESDAFQARLRAAEDRLVTLPTLRADVGLVDLSGLPAIVAFLSSATAQARTAITPRTHAYFTCTSSSEEGKDKTKSVPQYPGWAMVRMTEKEIDLSAQSRAEELVEAIEYTLQLVYREGLMRRDRSVTGELTMHTARHFPSEPVALRVLRLRRCNISLAEPLIAALRARPLSQSLLALDLSHNRLASLRFLFVLRAAFADRLLRLALANNPITQKPEYVTQVRRSLPRLSSLDGMPIRRPALRALKPWLVSYTLLTPAIRSPAAVSNNDITNDSNSEEEDDLHQQRVPRITAHDRQCDELQREELSCVLDVVARLFYIWEQRRVPPTVAEMNRIEEETRDEVQQKQPPPQEVEERDEEEDVRSSVAAARSSSASASSVSTSQQQQLPPVTKKKKKKKKVERSAEAVLQDAMVEQEMTEDTFAARYLHPSATFTLTMVPGLTFFDPATMRLDREVELDANFTGLRLSPHDLHDLRHFDVVMRNASRNLLQGRPALSRFGRGAQNCFLAYQSTLYPERMEVRHEVASAIVSVMKILPSRHGTTNTEMNNKKNAGKINGKGAASTTTLSATSGVASNDTHGMAMYVVTLHGTMTWRLPSMPFGQGVTACYDRVLTLCEKLLPNNARQRAWERLRSPPLVLYSDQLHLRPVPPGSSWCSCAYLSNTTQRMTRLVIEYGLEACKDGPPLVRAVMASSTSEAAEQAALEVLVFGPVSTTTTTPNTNIMSEEQEPLPPHVQAANEAARRVVRRFQHRSERPAQVDSNAAEDDESMRVYHIASLLDREEAGVDETKAFVEGTQEAADNTKRLGKGRTRWGSTPHTVSHAMLMAVVDVMNTHYTSEVFVKARMDVVGEL